MNARSIAVVAVIAVVGAIWACSNRSGGVTAPALVKVPGAAPSSPVATPASPGAPPPASATVPPSPAAADKPRALVYRSHGTMACVGCAESVGAVLSVDFDVTYVGPAEDAGPPTPALLSAAAVYAQPGGSGDLASAWSEMGPYADAIVGYVKKGGRYLGACMGGYLAGTTNGADTGFRMLPPRWDSQQYIATRGAKPKTTTDTTTSVLWRDVSRTVYFQDGPTFQILRPNEGVLSPPTDDDIAAAGVQVLGRYESNGQIAALVVPFGSGKVAVVGPHPEANKQWFQDQNLPIPPDGLATDLAEDIVEELMK